MVRFKREFLESIKKASLYALDAGTSLLGLGVVGLTGYGLLKVAVGAVPMIAGKFLLSAALVGSIVYPVTAGIFAGITLALGLKVKRVFEWTSGKRQEIRNEQKDLDDMLKRLNGYWDRDNDEIPIITKEQSIGSEIGLGGGMSDALDETKIETNYSQSIEGEISDIEKVEQSREEKFSVNGEEIEVVENNKGKGKVK